MKKLAIIPAYNEEQNIVHTIERLQTTAPDYDYLIIDDCSTDGTAALCRQHRFPTVFLPINLGIGGAVQTGCLYARDHGYDLAVQLDGDGQHDASFLKEMEQALSAGQLDMVIGSRFLEKQGFQSSGLRRVGISYFSRLIHMLTGVTISDPTSGLRMMNRRVIDQFAEDYPKDYPEPESVVALLRRGAKIGEIPVVMHERAGGVSSISAHRSVYYMIKVSLAVLAENFR